MTRGPLPARVYWTRRIVALVVVAGLVVALVQLASMAVGGSPSGPDRAAPMSSEPSETPAPPTSEPNGQDDPDEGTKPDKKHRKDDKGDRNRGPELAEPEGDCVDRDIAVTPLAKKTVGGSPVTFVLELRTILSAACNWGVSPESLTVKITSGDDDIWSSRQCPRAIPTEDVVIRNNVSTEVAVTWSARRSDDGCTRLTDWAMPGWYHVEAAALAGEPSDLQFQLTAPDPDVVTETVKPDPKKGDQKRDDKKRDDGKKNRDREGRG